MPDFAVRVRGAKGRSWRSPRRLVAVYLGLWVFALVVFLLMDPTDAMGYALLFHWLLLPIAAFVACGFEHCVANMYYFSMAGMWSGKALLYILVMTLGNAAGGVLFPLVRAWITN